MESAPALESRRSVFERLLPVVRKSIDTARESLETFYNESGFHRSIRWDKKARRIIRSSGGKTYIQYNDNDLRESVLYTEAIVENRIHTEAKRNELLTATERAEYDENMLLGEIAEGVGYEVLKIIFNDSRFEVIPATIADDRLNGSDVFVVQRDEHTNEIVHIYGIDITAAPEPDVLAKKVIRTLERTISGKLGFAGYLASTTKNIKERFSTDSVTKLILSLDEQTVIAYAQAIAKNRAPEQIPTHRILNSFREQIAFHEEQAAPFIAPILKDARQSVDVLRKNTVAIVPPTSWTNLDLLHAFHTDPRLGRSFVAIARDMKRMRKPGMPLAIQPYEDRIRDAVQEYMPLGEEKTISAGDLAEKLSVMIKKIDAQRAEIAQLREVVRILSE